ncbi:carboxypeptidase regulatory-like domain-containing protein [Rhodocaloribacter litoris]|uniref:carboxypeptidase regulatory-like domain-containing protein n=1 Tax=Rhodocaloribacter litoris TaxID=2558931 RepID=UPI001420C30B|nr:carboxypeptidase regulatory-like domain-containing protein [Rhodocaloribacter litoris]QXD15948.1 carboxypeptidase regulatory-like domain-containing protein [Rhodocaloribacter litoris]GIV60148.1 MAG: hypothetical protein KatS3mg043_1237 [Rhodothermaceae bacterium]
MRRNTAPFLSALILSLVLAGCGGGEPSGGEAAETPSGAAAGTPAPTGNAVVSGSVTFQGTPPQRQRLRLDADCQALHDGPVLAENVIVNENGTLRNVFVYVKEGLEGGPFTPPAEPVVFDQQGCVYIPHVFGIMAGQTLRILNSDPFLHNIHALPEVNRPFNFGMPKQGDVREQSFRVPEVMVRIKCDVHPWMSAYAGVLGHPFYSVTGEDGTFTIANLPAGSYVIEAWHEEYGTATQNVTVAEGETATVSFSFGAGT